jgi:hypothetical protein
LDESVLYVAAGGNEECGEVSIGDSVEVTAHLVETEVHTAIKLIG